MILKILCKSLALHVQKLIGFMIGFSQIVSAGNFKQPLQQNGRNFGSIAIQAQEQGGIQKSIKMTLKGVKLDKKDFFGW